MLNSIGKWDRTALVVALVFLHFSFFPVGAYALTIAPAFLVYFLFRYTTMSLQTKEWLILLAFFGFPLLYFPMAVDIGLSAGEYLSSYALFVICLAVLWFAAFSPIRRSTEPLVRAVFWVLVIVTVFCGLQVGLVYAAGDTSLYNPFGPFQYLYQAKADQLTRPPLKRAHGFYLEPSFAAQVVIYLCTVCLMARYRVALVFGLMGCALFFIQSRGGIVAGMGLALVYIWARDSAAAKWPLILAVLFGGGLAVGMASYSLVEALSGKASALVAEVGTEDASGYIRLVLGALVLANELPDHPFGLPFGSIGYYVEKNFPGAPLFTNNIYTLGFYFGIFGFLFVATFIAKAVRAALSRDHLDTYFFFCFAIGLVISGSLFSFETNVLNVILIHVYRSLKLETSLVAPVRSLRPNNLANPSGQTGAALLRR